MMVMKYEKPHSLPYISLYGGPDIARRNLSTLVSPISLPQHEGVVLKHM